MKLNLMGTESEKNLKEAFSGESQARNRYTYFAMQARNEGDEQVAELFETMADNELEHAKVWYKLLQGNIGDVCENLENAATAEHEEWSDTYPRFAQTAREEGFELLSIMFENIAAIEKNHEKLFLEMLSLRTQKTISPTTELSGKFYTCKKCGYVTTQTPEFCPVCGQCKAFDTPSEA